MRVPEIRKAGRLGNDRPSLGARLGCGISKPWGVWEGGFDERPGEPPADYLGDIAPVGSGAKSQKNLCARRAHQERQQREASKPMGALSLAKAHIFPGYVLLFTREFRLTAIQDRQK